MEQKQNPSQSNSSLSGDCEPEPTIFEQVMDLQVAMYKVAGLSVDHLPAPSNGNLPKWGTKILEQFCKTILKPILKLKPNGTVNWRNYGRMIGIIHRYETFVSHGLEQMWKEEGFDKITDEQWQQLEPMMGEEKLRAFVVAGLKRPVGNDEPLENLIEEALQRHFEHLENLKRVALSHVAQQDAKTTARFFKGMAEGYTCFLDESGRYVGDRGRTNIYLEFLVHQLEIEKYRRTMPVKSRRDLQAWVINETKIRILNNDEWFDRFCDEICLSMKGVGRKPNPQVS